jgi:hypothetical protein
MFDETGYWIGLVPWNVWWIGASEATGIEQSEAASTLWHFTMPVTVRYIILWPRSYSGWSHDFGQNNVHWLATCFTRVIIYSIILRVCSIVSNRSTQNLYFLIIDGGIFMKNVTLWLICDRCDQLWWKAQTWSTQTGWDSLTCLFVG